MLLGGDGEARFRNEDGGIGNLVLDYMLSKGLILVSRTAFVVGDMRSPTIWISFLDFFFLCFDSFCVNGLHHTQHISVFWCNLVPCTRNPGT